MNTQTSTSATTAAQANEPTEASVSPSPISPGKAAACKGSRGMSLIEIMVVLAIISMILGGIGVMAFNRFKDAQVENAKNQTVQIQQAVEQYMMQKRGKCPKTLQDVKASGFINKVSKDPWGVDYELKCPGEQLPNSVDVVSAGPDREFGTPDDIANYLDDQAEEDEDK
jgi:general secretion pathway protein G